MIFESTIKLPFSYAAGGISSRFLVSLRDERAILGARCTGCSTVTAPALPFCPACGRATEEVVGIGPGGTLEAWTEQPTKGVFGLIHLDGADTPLVHRLIGQTDWDSVSRVIAVFAEHRDARITDIEGFIALGVDS
ncbi:MAG: zinc ribbon domain-containing protein [Acidimicrobiia bacterium]